MVVWSAETKMFSSSPLFYITKIVSVPTKYNPVCSPYIHSLISTNFKIQITLKYQPTQIDLSHPLENLYVVDTE